tara:strand:- start:801 stop:1331 length:531 start_codon:yes stop_codon:yes gene_type:complete
MNHKFFLIFYLIFFYIFSYSQVEESNSQIDILRPSKAAFYSAVIPGLGQIYNKKAWKVPIVYAAIGISAYSYDFNKKKFWSYRDAYKRRKAGYSDDQYQGIIINDDRLIDGQDFHKKYKDLSMVFLVGFYFLNILDANIDAHLLDFNVDENLSFQAYFENDAIFSQNLGLKFKIIL